MIPFARAAQATHSKWFGGNYPKYYIIILVIGTSPPPPKKGFHNLWKAPTYSLLKAWTWQGPLRTERRKVLRGSHIGFRVEGRLPNRELQLPGGYTPGNEHGPYQDYSPCKRGLYGFPCFLGECYLQPFEVHITVVRPFSAARKINR